MKIYPLFFFLIILSACTKVAKQHESFSFDHIKTIWPIDSSHTTYLKLRDHAKDSLLLSTFIDSSWSIALETKPESLIGTIDKILIYEDIIYILDIRKSKQIFAFNLHGKFLFRVGALEDEYRYEKPYDFIIDQINRKILVYEDQKNQLLYYDLQGNFEKKESLNYLISNFESLSSGALIFNSFGRNSAMQAEQYFRLSLQTAKNQYTKKGLQYNRAIEKLNYQPNKFEFSSFKNETLFTPVFLGKVYSINQDKILLKYQFNFGDRQLPQSYATMTGLEFIENYQSKQSDQYIIFTGPFFETDQSLVFHFSIGRQKYCSVYNKLSSELSYGILKDDLSNSIEVPAFYTSYQDQILVGCKDSYYVKKDQAINSTYKSEAIHQLYNQVEAVDNPILSFYKIKTEHKANLLSTK